MSHVYTEIMNNSKNERIRKTLLNSSRLQISEVFYTVILGVLIGLVTSVIGRDPISHGILSGALVGGLIGLAEPFLSLHFRRHSLLYHVLVMSVVWSIFIIIALIIAHGIMLKNGVLAWILSPALIIHYIYGLVVAFILNLVLRFAYFLGPTNVKALFLGRYISPREEHKIFVFFDLVDSTSIIESIGDSKGQSFISWFLYDVSRLVRMHGGEVQRYVGDEVLATWPLSNGIQPILEFLRSVQIHSEDNKQEYIEKFGLYPKYRVGINGGSVIAIEVGEQRRSVEYFGAAVNTAARLESLAKTLDVSNLISAELLGNLKCSTDLKLIDYGEHHLRGLQQPLKVLSYSPSI